MRCGDGHVVAGRILWERALVPLHREWCGVFHEQGLMLESSRTSRGGNSEGCFAQGDGGGAPGAIIIEWGAPSLAGFSLPPWPGSPSLGSPCVLPQVPGGSPWVLPPWPDPAIFHRQIRSPREFLSQGASKQPSPLQSCLFASPCRAFLLVGLKTLGGALRGTLGALGGPLGGVHALWRSPRPKQRRRPSLVPRSFAWGLSLSEP